MRSVSYGLERSSAAEPQSPQVSIPWASLDSGLVFERDSGLFGPGSTQTLEPRLFYVYVPYRNQDAIPIFDTALADFNYAQLFTENRFVGGDRFGDANQVTLALTSRFLRSGGQEALRATIAQRYYFEDERVGLTPTSPLRSTTDSDILASLGGRIGQAWSFDATTQYNRHEQRGGAALDRRPLRAGARQGAERELPLQPRSAEADRHLGPVAGHRGLVRRGALQLLPPGQDACWKAWRASSTTPAAGRSGRSRCASRRPPTPLPPHSCSRSSSTASAPSAPTRRPRCSSARCRATR